MTSIYKLLVNESQTIDGIKKNFSKLFPFLKIEFFMEPQLRGIGSERRKMYGTENIKLESIQKIKNSGFVQIDGDRRVEQVESDFEKQYGLYIQVFRKSGKVWLATSVTDSWTLDEQNEEAKKFSERIRIEREDTDNHDVY